MSVSSYQINKAISKYMRNMGRRARRRRRKDSAVEDSVPISEEGMKRMLFGRIEENVSGRSSKISAGMKELLEGVRGKTFGTTDAGGGQFYLRRRGQEC
jgi:hypothetical protein